MMEMQYVCMSRTKTNNNKAHREFREERKVIRGCEMHMYVLLFGAESVHVGLVINTERTEPR